MTLAFMEFHRRLQESLYETTPKWHGFLMIKLAASAAGLNSEPQPATSPSVVSSELKNSGSNDSAVSNIEYRISNFEGWKRCALSFYNRQNTFIRRSMFDVHQFLFRLDWPFFAQRLG